MLGGVKVRVRLSRSTSRLRLSLIAPRDDAVLKRFLFEKGVEKQRLVSSLKKDRASEYRELFDCLSRGPPTYVASDDYAPFVHEEAGDCAVSAMSLVSSVRSEVKGLDTNARQRLMDTIGSPRRSKAPWREPFLFRQGLLMVEQRDGRWFVTFKLYKGTRVMVRIDTRIPPKWVGHLRREQPAGRLMRTKENGIVRYYLVLVKEEELDVPHNGPVMGVDLGKELGRGFGAAIVEEDRVITASLVKFPHSVRDKLVVIEDQLLGTTSEDEKNKLYKYRRLLLKYGREKVISDLAKMFQKHGCSRMYIGDLPKSIEKPDEPDLLSPSEQRSHKRVRKLWRAVPSGTLLMRLRQKLGQWSVMEIPEGYTSITCSKCGAQDSANRVSGATFKCVSCGYMVHANVAGAVNIAKRGLTYTVRGRKGGEQTR